MPASDRFVWKPGDVKPLADASRFAWAGEVEHVEVAAVTKAAEPIEMSDLSTLVRRCFLAFIRQQADVAGDVISLQVAGAGEITRDGEDFLIPYQDALTKRQYVARCAPDGSVRAEA